MEHKHDATAAVARRVQRGSMRVANSKGLALVADETHTPHARPSHRPSFLLGATASSDSWYWVPHDTKAFVPGRVVSRDGASVVLELVEEVGGSGDYASAASGGSRVTMNQADLLHPISRVDALNSSVADMVKMEDVNEPMILHNLRARFMDDLIYTNIGTILVSVNPFSRDAVQHLYSLDQIALHQNIPTGEEVPPHVFAIAAAAVKSMKTDLLNQSVIISGESGAGKTEATKKCLQYFAEVAGSSSRMEDKLLAANPILEAFGNAKTVRNNNSSRFGKWMEVQFDGKGTIMGCRIQNYLLEKSRVTAQAPGERNYHIFYELCALPATDPVKQRLRLTTVNDFLVTKTCTTFPGCADADDFEDLMDAFRDLSFAEDEQHALFDMSGAVLHLGNLTFQDTLVDGQDASVVAESGAAHIAAAASLLGVPEAMIRTDLVSKVVTFAGKPTRSPLTAAKANDARNSLIRLMYGRTFDWLVSKVNLSMHNSTALPANIIGVLDIFGFEIFDHNSFEQLCINFCNEKLQQHFNASVFKAEEQCYRDEGIDFSEVKFIDNQDVLDLVEKAPSGLLRVLDDTTRLPKGSDETFLSRVFKEQATNTRLYKPKPRPNQGAGLFGVRHYAGEVEYEVDGFLEKNRDKTFDNIYELLQACSKPMLKTLVTYDAEAGSGAAAGSGPAKQRSQGGQFREQLDSLMEQLNANKPHYIRCVKPNQVKKPLIFDAPLTLLQLRYAGVFEAVKIRQQGFPFRWTFPVFWRRYFGLRRLPGIARPWSKWSTSQFKAASQQLVDALRDINSVFDGCQFGRTMVLYKAEPHRALEAMRDKVRLSSALHGERVWRGYRSRKRFRKLNALRLQLRAAMRQRDLPPLQAALAQAVDGGLATVDIPAARKLVDRLIAELAVLQQCDDALATDALTAPERYAAAIQAAAAIQFSHPSVDRVTSIYNAALERVQVREQFVAATAAYDRPSILTAKAAVDRLTATWGPFVSDAQLAAAQEALDAIQREESLCAMLNSVLSYGGAEVVELSASSHAVEYTDLAVAVDSARTVQVRTPIGKATVAAAQLALGLRKALQVSDWTQVEAALKGWIALSPQPDVAAPEFAVVAAALGRRLVVEALVTALASPSPAGPLGAKDPATIDTAALDAAMLAANQHLQAVGAENLNDEVRRLWWTAQVIRGMRVALLHAAWSDLQYWVTQIDSQPVVPSVEPEVDMYVAEFNNHAVEASLIAALESGRVEIFDGHIDATRVSVTELDAAIAGAAHTGLGALSASASGLLTCAQHMRRLRAAIQVEDWEAVASAMVSIDQAFDGVVPPVIQPELDVVRDEAVHRNIVLHVGRAIVVGGPVGPVGDMDTSQLNVKPLEAALELSAGQPPLFDEERALLVSAEVVLALRNAAISSDWDEVVEVLNIAEQQPQAPIAIPEQERFAAEVEARWLREELQAALSFGRPIGSGGRTDPSAADATELTELLTIAADLPCTVPDVVRDMHAAIGLRDVRMAVAAQQWDEVHAALSAMPSGDALPSSVAAEVALVSSQLGNWQVEAALNHAVQSGSLVHQPVGEVNPLAARVEELAAVIDLAATTPSLSPHLQQALIAAQVLMRARTAVQLGDWDAVDSELRGSHSLPSVPSAIQAEFDRLHLEVQDRAAVAQLQSALSSGGATGATGSLVTSAISLSALQEALAFASSTGCRSATCRLLRKTAKVVYDVRVALKAQNWDMAHTVLKCADSQLAEIAKEELSIALDEVNNRLIVMQLTAALATGGASGAVGAIDTSTMQVADLEAAIALAVRLGTKSAAARELLDAAHLVRDLRSAVMSDAWTTASRLVDSLDMSTVAEIAQAEVLALKDECDDRRICTSLTAALTAHRVQGSVGALDISDAMVEDLATGVALATRLRPRTVAAKQLTATAALMQKLRGAVLVGDWDTVSYVMKAHKDANIAKCAADEFVLLRAEVENRQMATDLQAALSTGAAGGVVGDLDLSTIDTAKLDLVIAQCARVGVRTQQTAGLLLTAQVVRGVRAALQQGDKAAVEAALAQAVAAAKSGKLSSISTNELATVRKEMNNITICRALRSALATGGPVPNVGKLDTSGIDVSGLDKALELAELLGCHTTTAATLMQTAKVVRELRLALLAGAWDHVATVLQSKDTAPEAAKELASIRLEMSQRSLESSLRDGLATGRITGAIGGIDTAAISVAALEAALAVADSLPALPDNLTALRRAGDIIRQLRTAVLQEDWAVVESVVEAALAEHASFLPPSAVAEVRFLHSELANRSMISKLNVAMTSGHATGPVGSLSVAGVNTAALEAVVSAADVGSVQSPTAIRLLGVARLVLQLRQALVSGNWDEVAGVVSRWHAQPQQGVPTEVVAEFKAAEAEMNNRVVVAKLTAALSAGSVAGQPGAIELVNVDLTALEDALETVKARGAVTKAAQSLSSSATAVLTIRTAVLAGDWEAAGAAVLSAKQLGARLARECVAEVTLVHDHINHKRIVTQLTAALTANAAVGEIGSLAFESVSVAALDAAIAFASEVGCKAAQARTLLITAQLIRRLRLALTQPDWFGLEQTLRELKAMDVPDLVAAEVRTATLELNNHTIIVELSAALSRGMAVGTVGHQSYYTVVLTKLEAAIDLAKRLGCKTPEAHHLLLVAGIVYRLRRAQKAGDWEAVAAALQECRGVDIPDVCKLEIKAAQDEVDNRTVVAELMTAVSHGGATGDIGAFVVSSIVVSVLRRAVANAESLSTFTEEVDALLSVARTVLAVREALLDDDWAAVGDALSKAQRGPAWRVAQDELELVQGELDNRTVIQSLTAALSTGGATGAAGELDLSRIQVAHLAAAVAEAVETRVFTEEATQLLNSAQTVLALRRALAAEDWDRVERVLAGAKKQPLSRLVRAELNAAQDEVDSHVIESKLVTALCSGAATHTSGQLDVSSVDVASLDEAVALALELGCKTARCRSLLASARLVRDLRAALKSGDWPRIRECLTTVVMDGVAEESVAEVKVLQVEESNRSAASALTVALSKGSASGATGHMDLSAIELGALDESIAQASRLAVKSTEVQQLLEAAQLVRRLRAALLCGDWDAVRQTVHAAAGRTSVAAAVAEIDAAAAELDNYSIINGGLRDALSTGGVSGEVGSPDTRTIRLDALDRCIGAAMQVGCRTEVAKQLLASAQVVRRCRAALAAQDWAVLSRALEESSMQDVAPSCVEEVRRCRVELENHVVVTQLKTALLSGAAVSREGELDASVIHLAALDAAISRADELGCHTEEARELLHTARTIRSLRAALLHDDLPAMVAVLNEVRGGTLSSIAQPELEVILKEFDERAIVAELSRALSRGGPAGMPGSIFTGAVSLPEIDAGIGYATRLGAKSAVTRRLLFSAQLIRRLRAALAAHDMVEVRMVLETAERRELAPEAQREVQLVRQDLQLREVMSDLKSALSTGGATEIEGRFNAGSIALRELDTAIGRSLPLLDVSPQLSELVAAAKLIRQVRAAIIASNWSLARSALVALRDAGVPRIVVGEAEVCRRELARREAMENVLTELASASSPVDIRRLESAIARASELGLADCNDLHISAAVVRARDLLAKVLQCRRLLGPAAKSSDASTLNMVLQLAESLGYTDDAVVAVSERAELVSSLNASLQAALEVVDCAQLQDILNQAASYGVSLALADQARRVLALPVRHRLQLQLKSALARQDVDGIAKCTLAVKRMFLSEHESEFALQQYAGWRVPEDAHIFQPTPITQPLTRLGVSLSSVAIEAFRCVLGFMGDRPVTYPLMSAQTLISLALEHPGIRDELYAQIVCQVRGNPDTRSLRRGWQLLYVMLHCVPPTEAFENYLEVFLWNEQEETCLLALHKLVYHGPVAVVPSLESIQGWARVKLAPSSMGPVDEFAGTSDDDLLEASPSTSTVAWTESSAATMLAESTRPEPVPTTHLEDVAAPVLARERLRRKLAQQQQQQQQRSTGASNGAASDSTS